MTNDNDNDINEVIIIEPVFPPPLRENPEEFPTTHINSHDVTIISPIEPPPSYSTVYAWAVNKIMLDRKNSKGVTQGITCSTPAVTRSNMCKTTGVTQSQSEMTCNTPAGKVDEIKPSFNNTTGGDLFSSYEGSDSPLPCGQLPTNIPSSNPLSNNTISRTLSNLLSNNSISHSSSNPLSNNPITHSLSSNLLSPPISSPSSNPLSNNSISLSPSNPLSYNPVSHHLSNTPSNNNSLICNTHDDTFYDLSESFLQPSKAFLQSQSCSTPGNNGLEHLRGVVDGITPLSTHDGGSFSQLVKRRDRNSLRRILVNQLQRQHEMQATPKPERKTDTSGIQNTPDNLFGCKFANQKDSDMAFESQHENQHLTLMSLELMCRHRRDLTADPATDPILGLFVTIRDDDHALIGDEFITKCFLVVPPDAFTDVSELNTPTFIRKFTRSPDLVPNCRLVASEVELLESFIEYLIEWDPDIVVGYDIIKHSWGYLAQRASSLGVSDFYQRLGRVPMGPCDRTPMGLADLHIPGRISLNLWRVLRSELTLTSYTLESTAFHVLHRRLPLYSARTLADWYDHRSGRLRWRTLIYHRECSLIDLQLIDSLGIVARTSEFARIYGILFYSVLSRGSQYRVESMMLRLAKPRDFLALSPSPAQRAHQRAPEAIPLVMEPESHFYTDPVIVLDFQSLYPSIMIAYNYCYSTCLGRVELLTNEDEFPLGASRLVVQRSDLCDIGRRYSVSPNGIAFVNPSVRKGIICQMVEEILETRILMKQLMKKYRDRPNLVKVLDARQLGLKLIANVTYGYTGATFSGRMPCVDIADSIVRKARETLERAIQLVNSNVDWGARVVYGDTDSLFVLLKGASKERAFQLSEEIINAVTQSNPAPIKLKFEKVYLPCVLQTKKRYSGYAWESVDQKLPTFDAKGIETVRRDACPAVAKILEKSLRILYETGRVGPVRSYVELQWTKLLENRVSLQDLTFAREYRGAASYKPGCSYVPSLLLAKRFVQSDPRSEPQTGERVPFVIVNGQPGQPLYQLVHSVQDFLNNNNQLSINHTYYITKQIIPPLQRVFSLLDESVPSWYRSWPRATRFPSGVPSYPNTTGSIVPFLQRWDCLVCQQRLTQRGVCDDCLTDPGNATTTLVCRLRDAQRCVAMVTELCTHCVGCQDTSQYCISLDCPIYYKLHRMKQRCSNSKHLLDVISSISPPVSIKSTDK